MGKRCFGFAALLWCGLLLSCDRRSESVSSKDESLATKSAETNVHGEQQGSETGTIIVSAAASTKELMEALVSEFSETSQATVKINPGPSNGLANQIIEGAPADLFLSASREWAIKVADEDLAESSKELLTNKLVMIVPRGNPAAIKLPEDLTSDRVHRIALAGENVPAGKYADQALTRLDLLERLTAREKIARAQDVRGALSYVGRGEAEAGIVYSTDLTSADEVETVYEFDPKLHDEIVYVLVLLKHGSKKPEALRFFEFLQSDAVVGIYETAGFRRVDPVLGECLP